MYGTELMPLKNESKLESDHEYLRMCVQVSIPTIGDETFEPLFEICIRTKDVTLSVVLNDRALGTKGCETLGVEWE